MTLNRRTFLKGSGTAMALGTLPITAPSAQADTLAIEPPPRESLASARSELKPSWEVIIIGSGYGGSIMAARLAEHFDLAVLERGREWHPGEFPDTFGGVLGELKGSHHPLGLYDYIPGADVDVLVGSGLGGTSLINANVLIDPETDYFSGSDWPESIRQDHQDGILDNYRRQVLSVFHPEAIHDSKGLLKTRHLDSSSDRLHQQGSPVTSTRLNLAVNIEAFDNEPNDHGVVQRTCSLCGDCVTGCNVGAKSTLDTNYLPIAKHKGARIFTQTQVDTVEKRADGRYQLAGRFLNSDGSFQTFALTARHVILAAGSLGSTGLLLRSRLQTGLSIPALLGECFSGNADILSANYNQQIKTNVLGFGNHPPLAEDYRVGPTITAAARYHPASSAEFLIEDAAIPRALVDASRYAAALDAPQLSIPKIRRILRDLAGTSTQGAANHSMVYLGMGKDQSIGRIELDASGNPKVVWPDAKNDPGVNTVRQAMQEHTATFDGSHIQNPRSQWFGGNNLITVHPLGGCKIGTDSQNGVVNHKGQIFDPASSGVHAGLYVCDGAILPGAVGVNPMLTISILAERIADHFIRDNIQNNIQGNA
ncbi:hypothetical protein BTA51_03805 [Hahella sp. CCB-MM4]|uniref:GMC family oxidoreductase N-terminal domain-containing protein n=1 Tax=Hahella sp. (strain CCB-MM4) TaxID=1926491 RepID=UPI000B9A58CB|nr:GMC family oxidoreductase [Hahella sp. CCB-MM4]OZG74156.1 hypothetical protein BTA51_03805 [Hahella sp. CCB-MM4]